MKLIKRSKNSHKGQNGKVLVIGGSETYVGAVGLAALAALNTGVDLVYILAPEKVAWTLNTVSLDLITIKAKGEKLNLKRHKKLIEEYIKKTDLVILGNGLHQDSAGLVKSIVKLAHSLNKKLVLDAAALHFINPFKVRYAIMTPHLEEFKSMLSNTTLKMPSSITKALLKKIGSKLNDNSVIILKGAVDYIISNNNVSINRTGVSAMSKGGTGDILAGLCGGFAAQINNNIKAAEFSAYLNGKIGELCFERYGYSMTATAMIESMKLPKINRLIKNITKVS